MVTLPVPGEALHVPPGVASVSVDGVPAHTVVLPDIGAEAGLIVTTLVA
jgi:hypothetical protein